MRGQGRKYWGCILIIFPATLLAGLIEAAIFGGHSLGDRGVICSSVPQLQENIAAEPQSDDLLEGRRRRREFHGQQLRGDQTGRCQIQSLRR